MELDELKQAWQTLGRQLERQGDIQYQLLRERKLDGVRRGLRPLVFGQALQACLGLALVVLGVACWTRNIDVPGLLVTGIVVHAFGVLTLAMAGMTIALVATIDYSLPVVQIQAQMWRLKQVYRVNAHACGAPWWMMWVLVVVAVAGLGDVEPGTGTPAWIAGSLAIGLVALVLTYAWSWRVYRRSRAGGSADPLDESPSIRRGRRLLDDVAKSGYD